MKYFLLTFCVILFCSSLMAQEKDFLKFIPRDYDTLYDGVARADLNGDGIDDIVLALYNKIEKVSREDLNDSMLENYDSLYPRLLIVLFGTKNGFVENIRSANVIMCKECGGIFGDPFEGIEVKKNVLYIYHYGGSNWRWSYTYKFQFQQNDWYLIGETSNSMWVVNRCDKLDDFTGEYEDINFVTGQYEVKKISEDCKLLENKKGKRKIQPLLRLTEFDINKLN